MTCGSSWIFTLLIYGVALTVGMIVGAWLVIDTRRRP